MQAEFFHKYDILAFTESHLDSSIQDSQLSIRNYQDTACFRTDRTRNGGGIIVYINNSIPAKRRKDLEHDEVEAIWIEIKINNKTMLLGCVYRQPDLRVQWWSKFQDMLENIYHSTTNETVIITGDLNEDLLTNYQNTKVCVFEMCPCIFNTTIDWS